MYKKIRAIGEKAGKALTLSKYTTDLKMAYNSGRLGIATTSATVLPKIEDLPHFVDVEPAPQEFKAYSLWHKGNLTLPELCIALQSKENPLKESSVV